MQDIFLFHKPDCGPGNVGILYWCDPGMARTNTHTHTHVSGLCPGTRVVSEENSLPLAHISGVFIGKQSAVLKLPVAEGAVWNCCLSIISFDRKHDLHIASSVPQQAAAWLEGINSILS